MSIYLKSLRHLARDLARAARRFAEDYNRAYYNVARTEAELAWPLGDANVAEWGAL